jgi:hypothetical protein
LGGKLETTDGTNEVNGKAWRPALKIIKAVIAFVMERRGGWRVIGNNGWLSEGSEVVNLSNAHFYGA